MIKIASEQIALALYRAIRQDRANRYILTQDWKLPKLSTPVPDFEGERIRVTDSAITVKAYQDGYESDGCTLSPDRIGKWRLVIPALFHDPWYAEIDEIASAWGWSRAAVRRLGDELFACIAVATGTPRWIARVYLTGIRAFGGFVRWITALLVIATIAGCSGCAIPDHFGGQPVDQPHYEETPNNG